MIVKLVLKKIIDRMGQINRGARYRTDKQLHAVRMLDFVRFASFSGRFSAVGAPLLPLTWQLDTFKINENGKNK